MAVIDYIPEVKTLAGYDYFDTTLGHNISFNRADWVNVSGIIV